MAKNFKNIGGLKNMENEQKTIYADWNDIDDGYVKIEKDKAKQLMIIDWNLEKIRKFTDEKTGQLKENISFKATVLSEDGKPAQKTFTTTSISALKGLKEILKDKDSKKPVLLRIKKIGEGKATIYDIEELEIIKK